MELLSILMEPTRKRIRKQKRLKEGTMFKYGWQTILKTTYQQRKRNIQKT
jgi:hypothetical protein